MKKHILILALSLLVFSLITTQTSATVRKTGSQGDYFPLTFNLADGDVPALINVASINVLFDPPGLLFNPKEYVITKATPSKHHDIQGLDAPTLEFTSGEPYRLQMELFFDGYEEKKSVRDFTDKIEKLAFAESEQGGKSSECIVTWGDKKFRCVVEQTQTRFTLFLDDGTPLRAVMNIVFKEFSPVADQLKGKPRH